MKRILGRIAEFLFAIGCVVVIVSASVEITIVFRPVYYYNVKRLDIPGSSGYSEEECKRNYDALIDYNMIGGPEKLEFPTLEMSREGEIHFEEVKRIFVTMQWIAIIGMPLLLGRAAFCVKLRKRIEGGAEKDRPAPLAFVAGDIGWMHTAIVAAFVLAAAVLTAVLVNWQWAFETMHELFFDNQYWIFNPDTDPVIKILPEEFFMFCGILVVGLVIAMLTVLTVIYSGLRRKDKALEIEKYR